MRDVTRTVTGTTTVTGREVAAQAIGFGGGLAVLVGAIFLAHGVGVRLSWPVVLVVLVLVPPVVSVGLGAWGVRRRPGVAAAVGLRRPRAGLWRLLLAFPLMVLGGAAFAAAVGVTFFGGSPPASGDAAGFASLPPVAAALFALGGVVLVPAAEELLFRGFLLSWLRQRCAPGKVGTVVAGVASAKIFAACHVAPPVMAYVFVLGLTLAWARLRFDSLLPGLLLHAANNALVDLVALGAL